MMRSLYCGVSGIRSHQTRMDVIGNNVANVNTVGFKGDRVTFYDLFNQVMRGASAPTEESGGTNPMQIGLGVGVSSIDTIYSQGMTETTGRETDMAIDGSGFFIVSSGRQKFYTRAGVFSWDSGGNLVNPAGLRVMGWVADGGVLPASRTSANLEEINVNALAQMEGEATKVIEFARNLDARDMGTYGLDKPSLAVLLGGSPAQVSISIVPTSEFNKWKWSLSGQGLAFDVSTGYITFRPDGAIESVTDLNGVALPPTGVRVTDGSNDDYIIIGDSGGKASWTISSTNDPPDQVKATYSPAARSSSISVLGAKGETYTVVTTFERSGDNAWKWSSSVVGPNGESITPSRNGGTLEFLATGGLKTVSGEVLEFGIPGYEPMSINMNFAAVTQYSREYTALALSRDGFEPGDLKNIYVDVSGVITGTYSNGVSRPLAQIALADFTNEAGLLKRGETLFEASNNSGEPQVGEANTGSRGKVLARTLEASNVDLSQEFVDMIVTQRGFQANSRVITASDEMLQELVNLKR
ncbi:MAG TPA: flagellar hook protein FlgE [Clostridia bacterium]|nr:flagellar hook protein FlgE [Clostridia bacterium]